MKIILQKKRNKNTKPLIIIIKKKHIRKAVLRNKIKRRIKNAYQQFANKIDSADMILCCKIIEEASYSEIVRQFKKLFD